jgi:hypothetical protein
MTSLGDGGDCHFPFSSDGPFRLPEVFCWRILNQIFKNWIGLKYNTRNLNVSNL